MREAIQNLRGETKRQPRLMVAMVLALGLILAENTCHAQIVPSDLQAAIFFKLLSYDYNISTKPGSEITIAVIIDSGTTGQRDSILTGFEKLKGQQIGGKTIKIVEIAFSDAGNLAKQITSAKGDLLYLAAEAEEKTIQAVLSVALSRKCATLGGSEALVKRGFAIGLAVEGGKPKIVVNLPASQKQGMKLSSKVLGLAKVIK